MGFELPKLPKFPKLPKSFNFPKFKNQNKPEADIPDDAKGNPIYEQTRQDMPLWCCGRNCGRNTRLTVLTLSIIGITCSLWACLSVKYFSFVQLRNDTFIDPAKAQPEPFEYATEGNVGLFKYQIMDVFVFPWPPDKQERALFDEMLLEELRRLQDATAAPKANTTGPTSSPTYCVDPVDPGPGSVACGSSSPTTSPTPSPTQRDPNELVAETVEIGVVKPYPEGNGLDSTFSSAQRGAIMGPAFAVAGTAFGLVELCCCTYKCSWLPTAMFLYLAFMFQLFTMFLFLSEDWCKYDQECKLGSAGFASIIAVICYMVAQSLVCCSPRPPPLFNFFKKPPKKIKKKKRPDDEDDESYGLNRGGDYDEPDYEYPSDSFRDEVGNSSRGGYSDPYGDAQDDYTGYGGDSYMDQSQQLPVGSDSIADSDIYGSTTYADQSYPQDSYYSQDQGDGYGDSQGYDSNYGSQYDDGYGGYDNSKY